MLTLCARTARAAHLWLGRLLTRTGNSYNISVVLRTMAMAEEILNIPSDTQNIEYHIVTLFEKLDALRRDSACVPLSSVGNQKPPMQVEIRTLEFWRSIISECLASFFYVFIVCGAAVEASASSSPLATSLAAGFAMATLTQCFGHISGAHVNPSVTVAMAVTRNISPLRAAMFITAQCGGGIAGAALLYGVSVPGYQNNFSVLTTVAAISAWKRFGVEFILTFMVVFTYFVSMDTYRKWMGSSALAIGAAYSACSFFISMPSLNPARSLGPAFVMNNWDNHWVHWIGPVTGGIMSGLIYEFIFNPRRHVRRQKDSIDGDSSSIHSDEDTYDDLDKPAGPKFHGSSYNTYRPAGAPGPNSTTGVGGYCASVTSASLYSAPPTKLERVESLYGGTKSLYCKSPPLTRANLNRSQSVYAKSNTAINRDIIPRPGPLVPAQSLYPMRLNQQQSHVQNQNVQNQMQQRSESVYGVRQIAPGISARSEASDRYGTVPGNAPNIYGTRNNPAGNAETQKYEENPKFNRGNRPESMYGLVNNQQRRGQSAQSDDSSYGSYHGSNTAPRNPPNANANFNSGNGYNGKVIPAVNQAAGYSGRQVAGGSEVRQSPPTQLLATVPNSASFHHSRQPQHSPNSQY